MAYQKQTWRDFDDTKTDLQNINNGAVVTPERLNHIENGIANSADKAEVTAQLQQTEQELNAQLAEKADQTALNTTNATVTLKADKTELQALTGGARGLYADLAALKTAYPTGDAHIYLLNSGHYAYWDGTVWVDGGAYFGVSGYVKDVLDYATLTSLPWETGIYSSGYNTPVAVADAKRVLIPCAKNDTFRITTSVRGTSHAGLAVWDATSTRIAIVIGGSAGPDIVTTTEDYVYKVTQDAAAFIMVSGLTGHPLIVEKLQNYQGDAAFANLITNIKADKNDLRDYKKELATKITNTAIFEEQTLKLETGLLNSGYYPANVAFGDYNYDIIPCALGDKFRVNVTVGGAANPGVAIFDSAYTRLAIRLGGTDGELKYTDEIIDITWPTAAYIGVCGLKAYPLVVDKNKSYQGDFVNAPIIQKVDAMRSTVKEIESKVNGIPDNYWKNKKIVWFGTSIPSPSDFDYPREIGALLGANVHNEAVGSSSARAGVHGAITTNDPLGFAGMTYTAVFRSLSLSSTEKQNMFDNWSTYKTLWSNSPVTVDQATQDHAKSCSWDIKLQRHLGEGNRADLYVFDHGHNDLYDNLTDVPADKYDRTYFIGAMNFLINKILEDNPRARIAFIGHYENDRKTNISEGQLALANIWSYPLFKSWEHTGLSQNTVNTTGYWQDGLWVASGGVATDYTMTQIWMPDDLHPHSDLSGKACKMLADIYVEFIKNVVR